MDFSKEGVILKKTCNFVLKSALFVVLVCLGGVTFVQAQGPDQETAVELSDTEGQFALTFKQFNHSIRRLSQDETIQWYRLDLPRNLLIAETGNYLDLVTSHFPPAPINPSVLKVALNGQLLSTIALTSTNAVSNTTRLDFPSGLLQAGRNTLKVELDTRRACQETDSPLEVYVYENSSLSVNYRQISFQPDLALYPAPFVSGGAFDTPVVMVLPDQPTSADLSVAMTIAAGLGQRSGSDIDLTVVSAAELGPDVQENSHLILIGRPEDNSWFGQVDWPISIDEAFLSPGQGVIQEVVSPWNEFRLVLGVSGLDGEGLLKAAQALNRQAHFLGMRGPVAVVIDIAPFSRTTPSPVSNMTLADLNYQDQVFYGAASQTQTYDFNLPPGWQLEGAPSFILRFAHADILDSTKSILDLKLNNMPVRSILLDRDNASAGELRVDLPTQLLRTGANRLSVGIDMSLPDGDNCRDFQDQRLWTVISSRSELFLPYRSVDLSPDLSLFPYPFSNQVDGLDQTAFVLPDQLDPSFIKELVQLAVRLGSSTSSEALSIQAVYASDVTEDVRRNRNLIILGRPVDNMLLQEINAHLPQPFVPESGFLEPLVVDSVAFLQDSDRVAGLLEVINSPWNEDHIILTISGTTNAGVRLAVQTLIEQEGLLQGNLAVTEPSFNPLPDTGSQISTYFVDTRPRVLVQEGDVNRVAEGDTPLIVANRWWK